MPARHSISRFTSSTRAVTSIEYALIAAMVALAIISVLFILGQELRTPFNDAANGLTP